jgi:hypothetical protein
MTGGALPDTTAGKTFWSPPGATRSLSRLFLATAGDETNGTPDILTGGALLSSQGMPRLCDLAGAGGTNSTVACGYHKNRAESKVNGMQMPPGRDAAGYG